MDESGHSAFWALNLGSYGLLRLNRQLKCLIGGFEKVAK